jgi:hypothetical protein
MSATVTLSRNAIASLPRQRIEHMCDTSKRPALPRTCRRPVPYHWAGPLPQQRLVWSGARGLDERVAGCPGPRIPASVSW